MSTPLHRNPREPVRPFASVIVQSGGPSMIVTQGIDELVRLPDGTLRVVSIDGAEYDEKVLGGLAGSIMLRWICAHPGEAETRRRLSASIQRTTLHEETDHAPVLAQLIERFRTVSGADCAWLYLTARDNAISVDVGDWTAIVYFDGDRHTRMWDPPAMHAEISWIGDGPGTTSSWTVREGSPPASMPIEVVDLFVEAAAALERCAESLIV